MKQPNVAVFHVGRSGSRFLGDLFHQHPQAHWDGEVYERLFQDLECVLGCKARAGDVTIDPTAHLRGRMVCGCPRESLYGFEAKFFHLEILQLELVDFQTLVGYLHGYAEGFRQPKVALGGRATIHLNYEKSALSGTPFEWMVHD